MIFDHLEIMHRLSQSPTEFLRWIKCLMARVRQQNRPRKNGFLQLNQVSEAVDAYINQISFRFESNSPFRNTVNVVLAKNPRIVFEPFLENYFVNILLNFR